MLLAYSGFSPDAFDRLELDDGRTVHFYAVWPLYRSEMNFKIRKGADALLERFARHGVGEVVDPQRKNVCPLFFGGF
jgi:hypothetical protein